jgi:mevalonate kinase
LDGLLQEYLAVVTKAETAVLEGDMAMLRDFLCCVPLLKAARTAGAVGAKMNGTGRGGLMLALTPTVALQDTGAAVLTAACAPPRMRG